VPARRAIGSAAWICGVTAIAGAVTIATRAGWIRITDLAASPRAVSEGKLWLLLTSGVVADRPWLPSLLGFALVGFAALSVAQARVVVVAALAGHVLATLLVYGFLGASAAVDRGAFANLTGRPDAGLSAIIAAWIGVVSCVIWRRRRTRRAHLLNALGCIGCALIGFAFRPDVTALDTEHLVAFALGVAVAGSWPRRATSRPPSTARSVSARRRQRARPRSMTGVS
jgi:lambda repressor-like predicted transcriptional regulator